MTPALAPLIAYTAFAAATGATAGIVAYHRGYVRHTVAYLEAWWACNNANMDRRHRRRHKQQRRQIVEVREFAARMKAQRNRALDEVRDQRILRADAEQSLCELEASFIGSMQRQVEACMERQRSHDNHNQLPRGAKS